MTHMLKVKKQTNKQTKNTRKWNGTKIWILLLISIYIA